MINFQPGLQPTLTEHSTFQPGRWIWIHMDPHSFSLLDPDPRGKNWKCKFIFKKMKLTLQVFFNRYFWDLFNCRKIILKKYFKLDPDPHPHWEKIHSPDSTWYQMKLNLGVEVIINSELHTAPCLKKTGFTIFTFFVNIFHLKCRKNNCLHFKGLQKCTYQVSNYN